MSPRQLSDATIEKWQAWSRRRYGDDRELAEVAANAAIAALREDQLPEAAVRAGSAAADAKIAERRQSAAADSGAAEPAFRPAPGTIVGYAANVVKHHPLGDGGTIQTLEFEVRPLDGSRPIYVQMRGMYLEGVIVKDDLVQVPSTPDGSGFLKTAHVYNVTKQTDVHMLTGVRGAFGVGEARIGRKWTRISVILVAAFVLFDIIFFAVVIGFIIIAFGKVSDGISNFDEDQRNSKIEFCEDARAAGVEHPSCDDVN